MHPHTVLLIDDHALFRKGVAQLIQMSPLFSIAGEAASGREGVEMAVRLKPEVVLMDLNMPEVSGIETLQLMRDAGVNARFIMLTVSDHERDVVAAVLSDAVTGSLVHALSGGQRMPPAQSDLTAREVEVLDYLVEGMCNKVIARKLGISVGTVKVHVKHVLRKLDLHSRLEAVVWRHEHGSRER
ncbi:Nitrate/nitrite response regulator protein NarL [Paraburkholderia ribeironis]|uniref:Nitrate/nitrite response regulator protein NarL n=1 Tax=Paraburkholderia ribeironis TaxID=1247936 RepID=A0A1N7S288_9BURK|nr:LuxR C-terminal-related transcriptional regulator [Paraburkholderia ribeironis]SIT41459.1 Nitrate/nitrite response regulator protein NarL [Paraburkholderia ribeironis]